MDEHHIGEFSIAAILDVNDARCVLARQLSGRLENMVGWYHSHPGYGCWLSGIDCQTQMTQQMFQEPFLAIVIDPHRTIAAGKVELGAFRTYPEVCWDLLPGFVTVCDLVATQQLLWQGLLCSGVRAALYLSL